MDQFPSRLREVREAADLTQQELAARLGVKQPQIARWETGVRKPGIETAVKIAEALGTTLDPIWWPNH